MSSTTQYTEFRIGIGHDTHRLVGGGPLRIGGVDIPFDRHLQGHSDADVLLHAVTDALLGAAGLPDIGELFPNSDPQHRGRDSADFLATGWQMVCQRGWRLVNLDCIIFAEQPRISPFKGAIRSRLANLLDVQLERIGLKAKTGELIGEIGRGEAMAAECVALISRVHEETNEHQPIHLQ